MLSKVARVLLAFAVFAPGHVQAQDQYTTDMLRGARSAYFIFSEFDEKSCTYRRGLEEAASPLLSEIEALGLRRIGRVTASEFPDLSVLILVEAKEIVLSPELSVCAVFVKLEALHSVAGTLRYSDTQQVFRVLAYRTFHFGAAPRASLREGIEQATLRSIALFAAAYRSANAVLQK